MSTRILVVDDDALTLDVLMQTLDLYYDLTIAQSGYQALEIVARSAPFTVIISDLNMPAMDGIEFCSLAKSLSPDSICMLLSCHQELEIAQRVLAHGDVFRIMQKPCKKAELICNIDAAIKHNHTLRANRHCAAVSSL
jgi:CheY-like chemotaxis protein